VLSDKKDCLEAPEKYLGELHFDATCPKKRDVQSWTGCIHASLELVGLDAGLRLANCRAHIDFAMAPTTPSELSGSHLTRQKNALLFLLKTGGNSCNSSFG
jgi:hypothetical protein